MIHSMMKIKIMILSKIVIGIMTLSRMTNSINYKTLQRAS
jgi:hypothetical protein